MVSSDDGIPEPALNVVDAFVSKNEASRRLFAGDHSNLRSKSFRVPRNQNHVLEVRRDGEDAVLCLPQNSTGGHGLVSGNQLQTLTTASLGRTFQVGSHGFGLFLYPTDCLRAGRMHAPTELF
jgi:hypothetical protein